MMIFIHLFIPLFLSKERSGPRVARAPSRVALRVVSLDTIHVISRDLEGLEL